VHGPEPPRKKCSIGRTPPCTPHLSSSTPAPDRLHANACEQRYLEEFEPIVHITKRKLRIIIQNVIYSTNSIPFNKLLVIIYIPYKLLTTCYQHAHLSGGIDIGHFGCEICVYCVGRHVQGGENGACESQLLLHHRCLKGQHI